MNTKPTLQNTWTRERGGLITGQVWPFDGQGMDILTPQALVLHPMFQLLAVTPGTGMGEMGSEDKGDWYHPEREPVSLSAHRGNGHQIASLGCLIMYQTY